MRDQERIRSQLRSIRSWLAGPPAARMRPGAPSPEASPIPEHAVDALLQAEDALRWQQHALADALAQLDEQRTHSRALFDAAPDACIITDTHGVIQEANRAAGELFDVPPERLPGKPVSVFLGPAQKQRLWKRLARHQDEPSTDKEWQLTLETASGRDVLVGIRFAALRDGRALRWVLRDLTDRMRATEAERKLRHERAERRAAQTAAEHARFLSDAARVLNDAGDRPTLYHRICELAAGRLGEVALLDCTMADGRLRRSATLACDDVEPELARALRVEHGIVASGRIPETLRAGEVEVIPAIGNAELEQLAPGCAAQLQAAGFDTAAILPLVLRGEQLGVLTLLARGIGRSCARNVLFARAFADAAAVALHNVILLAAAQRANRMKTHFIGVMSHEFRTPLTSILGYADVLDTRVHGELNERQQRDVQRLRQSAWHLSQLVDQILDISREESSQETLQLASCDVGAVLEDVQTTLAGQAEAKTLAFGVDGATAPVIAMTDVGRLRQIVLNLVANAIKFTNVGAVHVALRVDGEHFEVSVRDTGLGIPADRLERVFEPFYREREAQGVSGTGLGLTVTRALTEKLGGTISVESKHGTGSTFRVRLPLHLKQS